ncbi:DNA methyltransferase [Leeuwenhoekiella sp. W20_SRS_FM14]|uniref:DNA methyltransferase n=1 Tax=Leeuwenhoekiella sp. W20_SRS_FM14 TaxID=3240270 RepID=UPI003F9B52F1
MKIKLTPKLISEIGVKEKYIRKQHYNSLKVWWARRPTTAMRNLLIQEVYKINNIEPLVDEGLISEINPSKKILESFSKKFDTKNIKVLDVFAGGGSIPFESSRLGFETFSAELNPVATLLQETIFNSSTVDNFSEILRSAGNDVIDRLETKYSKYYKLGSIEPYVIFYSKTAKCKECNSELELRKFQYLSKKAKKTIIIDDKNQISDDVDNLKANIKTFICSNCGYENTYNDIKKFCVSNTLGSKPFALCYYNDVNKKDYLPINNKLDKILKVYHSEIKKEIENLKHLIPEAKVSKRGGVINPTLYDLKKAKDFFNDRQLLILLGLIDEIKIEYQNLFKLYGANTAKQIVLALTSLIELLVDWNSTGTMWIPQNEQTGRSLAGPGVGMKWDYIEINPFYKRGSNLRSKLRRVCDTFQKLDFKKGVNIISGSSTDLPIGDKEIDIVLTDPPYYDSIDYTGLSEFFRPWFEVLIKTTFNPKSDLSNDLKFEAIVDLANGKKNGKNENHYKNLMSGVFKEVNRVLKPNGKLLLLYSHKTFEGWQVIAESLKAADLFIEDCVPIEMERIARPRAMSYEALNGVIVFSIKKDRSLIQPVSENVLEIDIKVNNGEILDSQKVIYLAALACKNSLLTGTSFEISYKNIIREYSIISVNSNFEKFDNITFNYISKLLDQDFNLEVLRENSLIDNEWKLIPFNLINVDSIKVNCQLKEAKIMFDKFRYNSKTKISSNESDKDVLIQIFSIFSGLNLNTVAKRSSSEIVKVSRLILSKI